MGSNYDGLMQPSTHSKTSSISPGRGFKAMRDSSVLDKPAFSVATNDFLMQNATGNISTVTSMDTSLAHT
jgi:hypothetical protein